MYYILLHSLCILTSFKESQVTKNKKENTNLQAHSLKETYKYSFYLPNCFMEKFLFITKSFLLQTVTGI